MTELFSPRRKADRKCPRLRGYRRPIVPANHTRSRDGRRVTTIIRDRPLSRFHRQRAWWWTQKEAP